MKSFNNSYLHHVCVTRVQFGEAGSCPIDQTPSQDFNIDPHTGRPMSDIQRLVHIQNDLQLASEFAQLHEFKPNFIDKEMSDTDAIKYAVPRLCQLPSEIIEHRVSLAKSLVEAQNKAKQLEFEKQENEFYESLRKRVSQSSELKDS